MAELLSRRGGRPLKWLLAGEIHEGELLRTLRKKVLGMSQQEYATLVGISRRSPSDLERSSAGVALLARLFKPLGLKPTPLPRSPNLLAPSALADQGCRWELKSLIRVAMARIDNGKGEEVASGTMKKEFSSTTVQEAAMSAFAACRPVEGRT